jgi:hypothetical protein
MKTILVITMLTLTTMATQAQGLVQFQNRDLSSSPPVNSPVYLDNVSGGALLSGTQPLYRVALLGGPTSAESAFISHSLSLSSGGTNRAGALSLLSSPSTGATWTTFRTGIAAGFVGAGIDAGRDAGPWSSTVQLQVVAWFGAFPDWNSAYNAWRLGDPTVKIGASNAIIVTLGTGPIDPNPTRLVGLQSFAIVAVPEPASIALGILGGGAWFAFRRRK